MKAFEVDGGGRTNALVVKMRPFFDILLIVCVGIILAIDQLNAQILFL